MKRKITVIIIIAILAYTLPAFAAIINIPDDYPTIQQGIDSSTDGDTVLVQPGTYVENINFNGHNITLGSMFLTTGDIAYVEETVIDGDSTAPVIVFIGGINDGAVIGFTIQNGASYQGAGIYCRNSGPIIAFNIIRDNTAYGFEIPITGGGIFCSNANPLIANNIIKENVVVGSYGSLGGGIYCGESSPTIVNSNISRNSSEYGAGLYCEFNSYPIMINTIFWDDIATFGSEIDFNYSGEPLVRYCNVGDTLWPGLGNISEDPLFRDPENGDFHLMSTACGDPYDSPCIDTGSPALIDSLLDCDWGLGTILSDMGAYGGGDSATVGIDDFIERLPSRFSLLQNYPNPFNPTTTIRYSLPQATDVHIEIYNILGQRVVTLFDGDKQAGYHTITWQADDYPSGVYFARLETGERTENIKMVLLK